MSIHIVYTYLSNLNLTYHFVIVLCLQNYFWTKLFCPMSQYVSKSSQSLAILSTFTHVQYYVFLRESILSFIGLSFLVFCIIFYAV